MRYILFYILLVFQCNNLLSQSLTVEYLDNWVKMCNPNIDFTKKEKLYVIEGVPLEGTELVEKLKSFDTKDQFLYIDYINSDSVETTFLRPNLIVVFVGTAENLKMKEKKRSFVT